MQGVRARLMEHVPLGETGLSVPLSGGLCEVWRRDVVGIDRVAIRAMGASPGLGTGGGAGQCRVVPQLGKQGEMARPRHGQGVVVAAVPVEPHGGPGDHPGDQGQQGVEQGGDAAELRGTCGVSCGGGVVLSFGRPGRRVAVGGCCVLASALAVLAACSAALRTTGSTRLGTERRAGTRTRDRVQKASPGTGLPDRLAQQRSRPEVRVPALVATTSSPPSRETSSARSTG
jgi:hypothetical protein